MFNDPLLTGLRKHILKWAVSIRKEERWGQNASVLIARGPSITKAHQEVGELCPMSGLPAYHVSAPLVFSTDVNSLYLSLFPLPQLKHIYFGSNSNQVHVRYSQIGFIPSMDGEMNRLPGGALPPEEGDVSH